MAQGMEAATRQSTELRSQAASGQPQNIQLLSKSVAKPTKKCYRCSRIGHLPSNSICHFRDQKCRKCGKMGHIAKVCNSREATDKQQQPAQRNHSGRPQQQFQRRPTPQQTKYVEGAITDDVTTDSGE